MKSCAYHPTTACETGCPNGCVHQPKGENGQAWWFNGNWRSKQSQLISRPPEAVKLEPTFFNPTCKHERTSYDIDVCDHCRAHTQRRQWAEKDGNSGTQG